MVAAAINSSGSIATAKQPEGTSAEADEPSAVVTTRPATLQDAADVAQVVRDSQLLEPNTTYAYVLLCSHFSSTSAVAECGGRIAGCCLGYRIPERPNTVFLWQIGVSPDFQRRGIARRLLDEIARREALDDVEYLEMSIAPSNVASRTLFDSWASRRGLALERTGCIESSIFGTASSHEKEDVFRIGPLREKL